MFSSKSQAFEYFKKLWTKLSARFGVIFLVSK